MSSIDHLIRQLAPDGIRINLWRSERGFQANVAEPGVNAWTVVTKDDPVEAVQEALRQRAGGIAIREVMAVDGFVDAPRDDGSWTERQTDLEDAIAAAPVDRDSEGFCVVCESGGAGCDACRPAPDDFAGLIG